MSEAEQVRRDRTLIPRHGLPARGQPCPPAVHDGCVEIELLVVRGCPNEVAAAELVRGVLDELGRIDTPLTVREIDTQADAVRHGFTGSPTLRINGRDPFAEPGRAPALACRVYATPAGRRGLPDADAVRASLRAVDPIGGNAR